ncbi:MAG: nucleotidyl transferase AbiEii/AbiGii toxin family protein [Anaerolinea sp.]|nr:nucleotidyl transferase AbiEii/AbiGii toxin family protein [Anaerolinea sp.]
MIGPYQTPQAFRVALETRLAALSQAQGTDLQRLQRRVAFERLLARLFALEQPPWLLKGGYSLELRLPDRARSTVDLDFSIPDPARIPQIVADSGPGARRANAFEYLQEMAERDLGDGFQFFIHQPRTELTGAPGGGFRCRVEARLAGRVFVRFHLDIGFGDPVAGPFEWIAGSAFLDFAGIPPARVAVYPLAQQFAEKIYAYTFPWRDRANTRVKDLADMVLLIDSGLLSSADLKAAVAATFAARNTHAVPASLPLPPPSWSSSYAALGEDLQLSARTVAAAYDLVEVFWQERQLGLRE